MTNHLPWKGLVVGALLVLTFVFFVRAREGKPGVAPRNEDDEREKELVGERVAPVAHLTEEAIARYGVTLGRAEVRVLTSTVRAPARVAFNAEAVAHIGSPLRGRITETRKVGECVTKGDVLFTLESPELGEAQLFGAI